MIVGVVIIILIGGCGICAIVGDILGNNNGSSISATEPPTVYQPTIQRAPQPTETQAELGFSRSNPAPIGTTVSFSDSLSGNTYYIDMTLERVVRGQDAMNMLNQGSGDYQLDNQPPDGKEYLLAEFNVSVTGGDPNKAYVMSSMLEFHVVSNGVPEDFVLVVFPDTMTTLPEELYSGGSADGWRGFEVDSSDSSPLIAYGLPGSSQNIWFATN
jgi:hypothetical protein